MDLRELDFYYDVGSPNAYLAWAALSEMGVELRMRPVLIGGLFKLVGNQPPWMAFGDVPAKMEYLMVEIRRFVGHYGLERFQMNPHFPVNTLLAMRVATAAEMEGVQSRSIGPLMRAMWEDGVDVSGRDELIAVLEAADLDGAHLVARAGEPEVKAALMAATQACADRGVFGLPSWFGEDGEMYFGKDCVWMMAP